MTTKSQSSEGKGIKPQIISFIEYNSNPSKYGLIDTWIKFNKFGKKYFTDRFEEMVKSHYKHFPNCDKPQLFITYERGLVNGGYNLREAEVHTWDIPDRTYRQIMSERFENSYKLFLDDIKGLNLIVDYTKQKYIINNL